MITVVTYIVLRYFFDDNWTGWLMLLPVLLDLTLIERISK